MKKRKLKNWVFYLLSLILMMVFILLLSKLGLIKIIDNSTIDILGVVILFGVYELIKKVIKKISF